MNTVVDWALTQLRVGAAELRYAVSLRALPARVAWFHWRAHRLARRRQDGFSLASVTRPRDLSILLSLARGRGRVAELGTATGWTALSLALAEPSRRVWSYDPATRPQVADYGQLVDAEVRSRVELITAPGSAGPPPGLTFDLLYVDSSHEHTQTMAEVQAWAPAMRAGALIVFDDYNHPHFPGVRQAVEALGLDGRQLGTLYVHAVSH